MNNMMKKCLMLTLSLLVIFGVVVWPFRLTGVAMTGDNTKIKADTYTDDSNSKLSQDETVITAAGAMSNDVNSKTAAADTGSTGSGTAAKTGSTADNTGSAENETTAKIGAAAADTGADVESSSVWERSFASVKLTGVWADDVLAIADTQLGYTESTKNYEVDDDGNMKGYTRYGAWYGNPYGDWCAMFVSFCLNYAEVDRNLMPIEANCPLWVDKLKTMKLYRDTSYTPKAGDIIFFDYNGNKSADHVGLVYKVNEKTGKIKTIEGDSEDSVRYVTYDLTDKKILGYGALPKNPKNLQLTQQTLTAAIYQDDGLAAPLNDGTNITVSGLLPANATITAYPVKNVTIASSTPY